MNNYQDYLERSGDECIVDYGTLELDSDHGFCIWDIYEDALTLVQVYGDGKYWNEWAEIKAKELGKTKILLATKRNPKGFCRKFNYKVTGYILERDI